MSPRRRALLVVVALLVAVGVVAAVVVALPDASRGARAVAQDRPGPVLLVPGYGGDRTGLEVLAGALRAQGRDARVLALDGDGTGDLDRQVDVLDRAVTVATDAGAPSVDVVGYSAGGVVAGLWAVRDDGPARARRIVSIGSPLAGTTVAGSAAALARRRARRPAASSSRARRCWGARRCRSGGAVAVGVDRPRPGRHPPTSARLDGAVNVELQQLCPGSTVGPGALPADDAVIGLVVRALSTAPIEAAPADCGTLRAAGWGDRALSSRCPAQLAMSLVARFAHAAPTATATQPACTHAPVRAAS